MPRIAAALILFASAIGAQGAVRWHAADVTIDGQRWTVDTRWHVRAVEDGRMTVDARVVRVRRSGPDRDTAKPTAEFLAEVRPLLDAACTLVVEADGTIASIDAPALARRALRESKATAPPFSPRVTIALRSHGKEVLCTFNDAWVGPMPGARKRLLTWIKDRQRMLGTRTLTVEIAPEPTVPHRAVIDVLDQCMAAEVTEIRFTGRLPSKRVMGTTVIGHAPRGAKVRLCAKDVALFHATAGDDGAFRFEGVAPARYAVRAHWQRGRDEVYLAMTRVTVGAQGTTNIGALAPARGQLTAIVEAADCIRHARSADVAITIERGDTKQTASVEVAIGRPFRIHGVGTAAGRVTLRATVARPAPPFRSVDISLALPASGTTRIPIGRDRVARRTLELVGIPDDVPVTIRAERPIRFVLAPGQRRIDMPLGTWRIFATARDHVFTGTMTWQGDGTDRLAFKPGARVTVQCVRADGTPHRPPHTIHFQIPDNLHVGGPVDDNGEVEFLAPAGLVLRGNRHHDGIGPLTPGTHRLRVTDRSPISRDL